MKRPYLSALLVLLLLAGCGTKLPERKTGATTAPAPGPGASEISSVRVIGYGSDPVLDAIISGFYKKYSNIRVEKVAYAPPGAQTINTTEILLQKLKNNEIDVFPAMADMRTLAKENLVLNLDPFIKKSGLDMKPFESTIGSLRVEGKVYGIPLVASPQAILYNVDMFAAKGVPLPRPGWSWDEFRTAAKTLTQGSGESKVWGMVNDFGANSLAYSMLYERAAGPGIEPQAAKEMLQYWSTLINTDASVMPTPKRDPNGGPIMISNPGEPFRKGTAAMTLVGLNSYQWLVRDAKFKWDVTPMPVAQGGKAVLNLYTQGYGIAAGSPNTEAAWKLLEYMASEEGASIMAKSGQLPVLRTPPVMQAWFEQSPPPARSTEFYFTAEVRANSLPADEKSGKISAAFSKALQGVLQGGADWEALYNEFLAEREKVLAGS